MLKTILVGIFVAILVVILGSAAYNVMDVSAAEGSTYNGSGVSVLNIPASDLNDEEAAALLFMREEEKLARDVYNKLYEVWGLQTFANIAASEQMHMDELALLLTRYNLTDPAQAPGIFTNPDLQALYDSLVAQGSMSLGDALKVGGVIEEIDILDLQTRLAQTDNADIQQVYTNLMNASYHHLNAFSTTLLNQTGETYQPQYLSADVYQSIMNSGSGYGSQMGKAKGNTFLHTPAQPMPQNRPTWAGGNGRGGNTP